MNSILEARRTVRPDFPVVEVDVARWSSGVGVRASPGGAILEPGRP